MTVAQKRTMRLATLPLTKVKQAQLRTLLGTYARAKDAFLMELSATKNWHYLDDKRAFRDAMKPSYPTGVSVHLVDQAAFDAVDTLVRHLESCIAVHNVKQCVYRHFSDETTRRYAYTCLKQYRWVGEILAGSVPSEPCANVEALDDKSREIVCRYLHRVLRKALENGRPRVHVERSVSLDDTLYSTLIEENVPKGHTCNQASKRCRQGHRRQYLTMIGPHHGKRIRLPLAGLSRVSGNIRVVFDQGDDRAAVHVAYDLPSLRLATGESKAIDWGVTEVCTDSDGVVHGEGLGKVLMKFTDTNNRSGKARGKLHALRKINPGSKRAKHIAKNNLGRQKQRRRRQKAQAAMRTLAGAAVKEVVYGEGNRTRSGGKVPQHASQRPQHLVIEDLSRMRDKARSKRLSRIFSTWMRSENQSRVVVHTSVGGTHAETVNTVYTSQTCPEPTCGFVSAKNRKGERFHCQSCGWRGGADHVAAMNLLSRLGDREITTFTHGTKVKEILDQRFLRRKENQTRDSAVPLGTTGDLASVQSAVVEGEVTAHGRTPSKPPRKGSGRSLHGRLAKSRFDGEDPDTTKRLESENKRMPRNA